MPEHLLGRNSTSQKHLLANHMFGASGLFWHLVSFGKFIHDNPFNFSKTFASNLGIPWFSIWVASWIQCLARNSWERERAVMAWMTFTRGCQTHKSKEVQNASSGEASRLVSTLCQLHSHVESCLEAAAPQWLWICERLRIGQSIQESDHF